MKNINGLMNHIIRSKLVDKRLQGDNATAKKMNRLIREKAGIKP